MCMSAGTRNLSPAVLAQAGWLWSRRRGVVAGFSASALHGSRWVDASQPVELIHQNRNHPRGLRVWGDRLEPDEMQVLDGVMVTTPARTALDLACWYPTMTAVPAIDALARACELKVSDVDLLVPYGRGRRGISACTCILGSRRCRSAVTEGELAASDSGIGRHSHGHRRKFRLPTSSVLCSRISTWAGKNSKSRWNTTASNIGLIGRNTNGTYDEKKRSSVSAGW